MKKKNDLNETLRLLIKETEELKKTCEYITKMFVTMEITHTILPDMEKALVESLEKASNKRKKGMIKKMESGEN